MKKTLVLALLLSTSSAYAADNKYYATLNLASLILTNASGYSIPDKIGIGAGYNLNDTYSAEVSYQINSDSKYSGYTDTTRTWVYDDTEKTSSVVIAGVANFPVGKDFVAFGKLGLSQNSASGQNISRRNIATTVLTYSSSYVSYGSSSSSKTDVYFALGAKYKATKTIHPYLQYESFGAYGSGSNAATGSATSAGVNFEF